MNQTDKKLRRIDAKDRKKISDALYDLCKNRLPSIPSMELAAILEPFGITLEDGIYCGRDGRSMETLTRNGITLDHYLVLNWHKGEFDRQWEINAYLS